MITKINRIKNLGFVFSNYTWDTVLPLFKQFNLVYGWTGSGKTTLSRLFDAINGSPIENLEYEIEDEQGNKYKQGDTFPKNIRVFNQEYIQNNIQILEGTANSISVLLGEENKDLLEDIGNDKKLLDGDPEDPSTQGKTALLAGNTKEKGQKLTERNSKFTEIAKTIGAAIGGNALRDYRKPEAEKDFISLTVKSELPEEDLEKCLLSVKQESLSPNTPLVVPKVMIEDDGDEFEISHLLESIESESEILLQKTVESEAISRLEANEDISQWVEQGFHLHKKHSSDICEYCSQKIPIERVEQLARHFNEVDRKLKDDLDVLIEKLRKVHPVIKSLLIPDRARFYPELQEEFDEKKSNLESVKEKILKDIAEFAEELKSKKSKTTEALVLKTKIAMEDFIARIDEVNEVISRHNKTTSDFKKVKEDAVQKLKTHYLSTIFDDVEKLDAEMLKLKEDIVLLTDEIGGIQKRIAENMAQISSAYKACEDLNKKLSTFLGHEELTFVPNTKKESGESGEEKEVVKGYNIRRGVSPAYHLSEGEKTAIAFVYFIVHLGDQNFNTKDGIIVIDDPVSSLDSNSLYQAFSFLKNAVKDGMQVFILTHSFDFLKLLINWRQHDRGGTGYFMIKNNFPSDVRCAYIAKMDKELYKYKSEYHYLFKLLKKLRDEQDDTIAKAYPIPNIARKVWETFLMFSVPNGKSSYNKMEELKDDGFDEQKMDAIYKFTNDQSHITGSGFDPALVPGAKKVVNEIFEMMSRISPRHFKIIDEVTNDS